MGRAGTAILEYVPPHVHIRGGCVGASVVKEWQMQVVVIEVILADLIGHRVEAGLTAVSVVDDLSSGSTDKLAGIG